MITKKNMVQIFIFILAFLLTSLATYNTFYSTSLADLESSNKNVILDEKTQENEISMINNNETNSSNIQVDEESKNDVVTEMDKVENIIPDSTEEKIIITYYVRSPFNVLLEPDENSQLLGSVSINEPIEVLEETEEWAKIRIPVNGLEGYTFNKAYSLEKIDYINNVPFLNQISLGYPTGCEAVSATMVARFEGYDVDVQTIVDNTPTDTLGKRLEIRTTEVEKVVLNEESGEEEIINEIIEEEVWVGENPFEYFVGYPTKTKDEGSYGCYAHPIEIALKASEIPCTNISGCPVEELYDYIKQGKPVVVWGRLNARDLTEGVTWVYPDGSGEYVELVGEHCFVLIGFDDDFVYLNDPIAGAGVKQSRRKFEKNWHILFDQALIVD